jgi:hypothetical protein
VGSPLVALVMWTREVIPIVLGTGDISQRQNPMRGILKLGMGEGIMWYVWRGGRIKWVVERRRCCGMQSAEGGRGIDSAVYALGFARVSVQFCICTG